MIRDSLPKNLKYVAGSAKLLNQSNPNGLAFEDPTIDAVNVGNYKVKGDAYLRFTAEVVDEDLVCNKTNRLINWAKVSANGFALQDSAQVYVKKTCKNVDPEPKPDDDPDDTPVTIVETGAGSVAAGALGAGSVVTMLGYYIASRKKLM